MLLCSFQALTPSHKNLFLKSDTLRYRVSFHVTHEQMFCLAPIPCFVDRFPGVADLSRELSRLFQNSSGLLVLDSNDPR
jgi:hypothetical protein